MKPLTRKDRAGFEKHAALSAIKAHITAARRRLDRDKKYLGWLEVVLIKREAQVAHGVWP